MVTSAPAALGLDPRIQAVPLRRRQFQGSGLTREEVFALSAASGVCRGLSVTKGNNGRTQSQLEERAEYERLQHEYCPVERSVMAANAGAQTQPISCGQH